MHIIGTHKPFITAKIVSLLLMLVLIFCAGLVTAHGQGTVNPPLSIPAYLDGACEAPPNGSAYTGTAFMSSLSDANPLTCTVTLPTSFPAVDVGIYGPATPFQTAPLLFDLGRPGLITNILVAESFDGTIYFTNVFFGCFTNLSLTPQQFNDLNAELLYVNVTSAAYPGGEIRGQFSNQPILSQPAVQNGKGAVFNVTYAPLQSAPPPVFGSNPGENYEVQVSTDLLNWTTFTNLYSTNIAFQVVDTEGANTNESQRFYRVKMP